jgi:hypothetical protein
MGIKLKHVIFEPGKTFIHRHILNKHWHTCPIALLVLPHMTVVSATSAPPLQPLRHQWNFCHPVVNRFTWQTLPTVNTKHFFMNILCIESSAHNRTMLFCSNNLKHGNHFFYWNQPLNMRTRVCYLDCHEARLCCYFVIRKSKKSIPVRGREGPQGCERSRLPHLLDNRLTDGGKVVTALRAGRALPPRNLPGTHFC